MSHFSLFKKTNLLLPLPLKNLLKTFLIPEVFFLISALVRIFLLSSFPEGSPTIVVPPPNKTIGV